MSYGWLYRAFQTTDDPGSGDLDLDIPAVAGYQTVVNAAKAASGIGTGPWAVEVVVTDVPQGGTAWEILACNVEEGTGAGGRDKLKKSTGAVKASSNSGAPITWGSSPRNVFGGPLASKAGALFDKLSTAGFVKRVSEESFAIVADPIPVANGGTGATTAANARANLSAMEQVLTTIGDMVYRGITAPVRLAIGAADQFLRVSGGFPTWTSLTAAMVGYTPTSPVTGTTVNTALTQLTHPKGSITSQATAQDNVGTSEVAITDLDDLALPGTPDGTKVYALNGQVTVNVNGLNSGQAELRVRTGPNGNLTDTLRSATYISINDTSATAPKFTIQIPRIRFVPSSGHKVTVSILSSQANLDVVADAEETWVWIEQISNA